MVQRTLDALRGDSEHFDVHHINARFSETLQDIGESSFGKLARSFKYLGLALAVRARLRDPILLYVPGPVHWSPVLRDWILLMVLRLAYRRVVFHWHAIGQGEWAHGSTRLAQDGPRWLDRCARFVSRCMLEKPEASIVVSETSRMDAIAVASRHELVVSNGIEDPCPDYQAIVEPARLVRSAELSSATHPCFRILFLSHGTIEKGVLDAALSLRHLLDICDSRWRFEVTFAGGLGENAEDGFKNEIDAVEKVGAGRIKVRQLDYVTGSEKRRCYLEHDIFLSPSRWESFGLTVLEAMAYGMQIVAAASDGVQGVLPPRHPWLAPVADPATLAAMLHECCARLVEEGGRESGGQLRQRFLQHFQLKDFSNNLRIAFRDLSSNFATCSGGVSSPVESNRRKATVIDRRCIPDVSAHSGKCSTETSPVRDDDDQSLSCQSTNSSEFHTNGGLGEAALPSISVAVYLADQNPGYDRSFGISRMSQTMLAELQNHPELELHAIVSETSQQPPSGLHDRSILAWGTRGKLVRLLTDHFHPLFCRKGQSPDIYYFPKGYLPLLHRLCRPSVVTIHDTIIQYDEDHYPSWRKPLEYAYWSWMLRHTLRNAGRILTVSESSKLQIERFMERHRIPRREITVTYEPCQYECMPQEVEDTKENYVIHLASREPHKRTAHLIRWWSHAEKENRRLPTLHLIGTVPQEVEPLLASSRSLVKRPFLDEEALQAAYRNAKALILPSEIEGFGLPALEAYYLGTPVCHVRGTSVEEVLSVATSKGGFTLDDPESLFTALDEVMAMPLEEIRECGLKLRETYASRKVAERMIAVFQKIAEGRSPHRHL